MAGASSISRPGPRSTGYGRPPQPSRSCQKTCGRVRSGSWRRARRGIRRATAPSGSRGICSRVLLGVRSAAAALPRTGRTHGKQRVQFYACVAHWKTARRCAGNGLVGRMEAIDAEVLATLQG